MAQPGAATATGAQGHIYADSQIFIRWLVDRERTHSDAAARRREQNMKIEGNCLVLSSGGLDSTTVLYNAARNPSLEPVMFSV